MRTLAALWLLNNDTPLGDDFWERVAVFGVIVLLVSLIALVAWGVLAVWRRR